MTGPGEHSSSAEGQSPIACANCGVPGMPARGPHCTHCGAEIIPKRLTFADLSAVTIDHFLSLDVPFLRTVVDLSRCPGRVVAEYVAGKRRTYTNPLKFYLITATVLVAVIHLLLASQQVTPATLPQPTGGVVEQFVQEAVRLAMTWHANYIQLVYLLSLPLFAGMLYIVVGRRGRRSVMELFVMCLFAWGQIYLVQAVTNFIVYCSPWSGLDMIVGATGGLWPFVYVPWIAAGFCRVGVLRAVLWSVPVFFVYSQLILTWLVALAMLWKLTQLVP